MHLSSLPFLSAWLLPLLLVSPFRLGPVSGQSFASRRNHLSSDYVSIRSGSISRVSLPRRETILCDDSSWDPTPQTWRDANVDSELATWWASEQTKAQAANASFVDWLARSFGDMSRNQECGIGLLSSCSAPDCSPFASAGGPKWAYFVRVSLMEMNILLNNMMTGISNAESDLSLTLVNMSDGFFPWEDPRADLKKALPFMDAMVTSGLALLPLMAFAGGPFVVFASPVAESVAQAASAFASAGFETISSSGEQRIDHDIGTISDLGSLFKTTTANFRTDIDSWSKTVFSGSADMTGKSILDYLGGGRFTLDYSMSVSEITNMYFQLQISQIINQEWQDYDNAGSYTYVMCTNTTGYECNDETLYQENGRTCCLYSLKYQPKGGLADKIECKFSNLLKKECDADHIEPKLVDPPSLDKLAVEPYNINLSSVTASSLHSYLVAGFSYDQSNISQHIIHSVTVDNKDQFLLQGVAYQGIWNLSVCDNGPHSDWLVGNDTIKLPCCCGPNCTETKAFLENLGIDGEPRKAFNSQCKKQWPSYTGMGSRLMSKLGILWSLGLVAVGILSA